MPRPSLVALLVLSACTGREEAETLGGWVEADEAVGVSVQRSIGPAPHLTIARAINRFGAAVPSPTLTVDIDQAPVSVPFNPVGYGEVELSEPGVKEVWSAERVSSVYTTAGDFSGLGLLRGNERLGEPTAVAGVTGGALVAIGRDVWFVTAGEDAHRVMSFPEELGDVQGMITANLDFDASRDAVVWAGNTVVLLGGRAGGGMIWKGAIAPSNSDLSVGAVAIDDVNGDDSPDVVIAWASLVSADQLQVWAGNGLFAFADWPTQSIRGTPTAMAIGDNIGDDTSHITVLLENDTSWQRWSVLGTELLSVGPALEDLGMPEGSTLSSGVDYNGDGAEELLVIAPLVPGSPRIVKMFDLGAHTDGTISFIEEAYQGGTLGMTDGDGDGIRDLFVLEEDGRLVSLTWNGASFTQKKVAELSGGGAFAFSDLDADGNADLFLAGETWSWWDGQVEVGTSSNWWGVRSPAMGGWDLKRRGPVHSADTDGDPATIEVLSVVVEDGTSYAQLWNVLADDPPSAQPAGKVAVSVEGAEGLDIAVCGTVAYVLTETSLSRIDLTEGTRTAQRATVASRVACGAGPSASVAAILEDSTVTLLDAALNSVGTEQHPGAQDLALVNLSGAPRVGICAEAGCAVERWSLGELDALLVGTPDSLWAQVAGGRVDLDGRGIPATADINADGWDDAVVIWPNGSGTAIGVFLGAGGSFGPSRVFHTSREGEGPAIVGDVTGNGAVDVLFGDGGTGLLTSL